jgi:hypothetical protein
MVECRHCGEVYWTDPERVGARCRRCREPLYERPQASRPPDEPPAPGAGVCAVHPRNASVGVCQRCGTYMCAVCRTRWHDRALCLACLDRVIDAKEARPEDVRAHRRQAMLALLFGITAWALVLTSGVLLLLGVGGAGAYGMAMAAGLLTMSSLIPSMFGLGQAAAAIRTRGNRMIMATLGLVLSGSHVGILLGMMLVLIWPR